MARRTTIEGMAELERAVRRMGQVPKKVVTKAARAGAKIAYKSAKVNAPTGVTRNLKKGIIMRVEKQKKVGKRMFDVMMSPKMTDIFVKDVENPTPYNRGNDPTRAYYPASQEYGFMTVNGRLIPGKGYMRKAVDGNKEAIEKAIIDVGLDEIDKAWNAR
jgi:hypothetical protein